jgi:hypothetical protein
VVGEQAGGVTDRFGGRREGRSSPVGFSTVEGISGGEETVTNQSRGHRRGSSGWEDVLSGAVLGWGRDGRRMAGVGYPRWLDSAREERRWWSGGAAEGAGKEVGGAPGVCAELGVVTKSSERDRGGVSWWLNDGGMMAQWQQRVEEEKGSSRGGALLLKAARGGGRGRRKRWAGRRVGAIGEAVGGQGGGRGRYDGVVVRTVWLTSGPTRFYIFLNYPN